VFVTSVNSLLMYLQYLLWNKTCLRKKLANTKSISHNFLISIKMKYNEFNYSVYL